MKQRLIRSFIFNPYLLNLVSLSRLALASRSTIIVYNLTSFLDIRLAQMLESKCPISHTTGCSSSAAFMSRSRRRILLLVIVGRRFESPLRSRFPALALKLQLKKACCWFSTTSSWQSWQLEEIWFLVILWTQLLLRDFSLNLWEMIMIHYLFTTTLSLSELWENKPELSNSGGASFGLLKDWYRKTNNININVLKDKDFPIGCVVPPILYYIWVPSISSG